MDCPACHHPNVDGARFCAKCGSLIPHVSAAGEDPLIGQIIGGRYRITKLLGEGGMGRVYLGEQQMGTNVRKVAVKTLQEQYAKDPQILARFHRECGTVSELEHPNTIQFFDFGQTPSGELYIAMEFVQGESLADALTKGGPMPPERAARIMAQVCGSLQEAHDRGVVHRDLKPDNIILTTRAGQPDFVKVLDFGIAKRSEKRDSVQEQKLTQQGMVLGTPPYMSPEQFTGKELDARSDIYSLGVLTYEMLTGRLPFDADTPWQWATQHMTAQPFPFETLPVASHAPPKMKAAIMRALSKNRDDRQTSAQQFYEEMSGDDLGAAAAVAAAPANPSKGGTAAMSVPDLAPPAQPPRAKTELGAPPNFAADAMPAPVAAPAPAGGAYPTPAGGQSFPTTPQPATSASGGKGGSNKGLVMGLGGAAGVLLIIGVVVAARGMKPKDEVQLTNPFGTSSAGATSVGFVPPETNSAPAVPSTPATVKLTPPPTGTTKPTATTTATAAPGLKGDAACMDARTKAQNGDIIGASHSYSSCDGPQAGAAKAAIAAGAPKATQAKIFNGDCAGAKAVVAAANAAGAGAGAAGVLNNAPQCKGK